MSPDIPSGHYTLISLVRVFCHLNRTFPRPDAYVSLGLDGRLTLCSLDWSLSGSLAYQSKRFTFKLLSPVEEVTSSKIKKVDGSNSLMFE